MRIGLIVIVLFYLSSSSDLVDSTHKVLVSRELVSSLPGDGRVGVIGGAKRFGSVSQAQAIFKTSD